MKNRDPYGTKIYSGYAWTIWLLLGGLLVSMWPYLVWHHTRTGNIAEGIWLGTLFTGMLTLGIGRWLRDDSSPGEKNIPSRLPDHEYPEID